MPIKKWEKRLNKFWQLHLSKHWKMLQIVVILLYLCLLIDICLHTWEIAMQKIIWKSFKSIVIRDILSCMSNMRVYKMRNCFKTNFLCWDDVMTFTKHSLAKVHKYRWSTQWESRYIKCLCRNIQVFCIDIKFKTIQISLNMAVGKCKNMQCV